MSDAMIFNSDGNVWNWVRRCFMTQPSCIPLPLLPCEYEMARRNDKSADIVWFDRHECSMETAIEMARMMNR